MAGRYIEPRSRGNGRAERWRDRGGDGPAERRSVRKRGQEPPWTSAGPAPDPGEGAREPAVGILTKIRKVPSTETAAAIRAGHPPSTRIDISRRASQDSLGQMRQLVPAGRTGRSGKVTRSAGSMSIVPSNTCGAWKPTLPCGCATA